MGEIRYNSSSDNMGDFEDSGDDTNDNSSDVIEAVGESGSLKYNTSEKMKNAEKTREGLVMMMWKWLEKIRELRILGKIKVITFQLLLERLMKVALRKIIYYLLPMNQTVVSMRYSLTIINIRRNM